MKNQVRKYFSFSQSDKNVLLLLCFALAAMLAAYWLIPRYIRPDTYQPDKQFEAAVENYRNGLVAKQEQAHEADDYRRKHRRYNSFAENGYTDRELLPKYNNEQRGATPNAQAEIPAQPSIPLTPFDPNQLDAQTGIALGLPPKIAKNIEKYLQKGGRFRKKEDLRKIYGFSESDYQRLEPYISLPETSTTRNSNNNYPEQRATAHSATYDKANAAEDEPKIQPDLFSVNTDDNNSGWRAGTTNQQPRNADNARRASFAGKTADLANLKIDINTADTTEWKKLPGIGSGRAKMIVKFRNSLGGFASVEQIKETFSLPPEVYDQIAPYLENKHSEIIKKINVNVATYDQLNAHPYIDPKVAKVIVKYREQHGKYAQISDLKKTDLVDDALLSKVAPYLSLQ